MKTMNEKCCNLIFTSTYNATTAQTSIKRLLQSTQSEHATGAIGFYVCGKNSTPGLCVARCKIAATQHDSYDQIFYLNYYICKINYCQV